MRAGPLILAVLLVAVSARAERGAAPVKPLAQSLTGEAKTLYLAGVSQYRKKEYAAALAQFRAAHNAEADPRLLWNMAVCEKNLSRFVQARALAEEYLSEAKASLTDSERDEASRFATSLRSYIARVSVRTTPPAAMVFVDDVERGTSPITLELDMGEHTFRLQRSGFKELTRVERFEGASEITLDWPLEAHDARLNVVSSQRHAVALNGRGVGLTPWSGALAPGAYEVELSSDGFKRRKTSLTLGPSETRTVELELERDTPRASSRWPWVIGISIVVVAAAAVGGYFLLSPSEERPPPTPSTLGSYQLP
jgi:hypothetical protein